MTISTTLVTFAKWGLIGRARVRVRRLIVRPGVRSLILLLLIRLPTSLGPPYRYLHCVGFLEQFGFVIFEQQLLLMFREYRKLSELALDLKFYSPVYLDRQCKRCWESSQIFVNHLFLGLRFSTQM